MVREMFAPLSSRQKSSVPLRSSLVERSLGVGPARCDAHIQGESAIEDAQRAARSWDWSKTRIFSFGDGGPSCGAALAFPLQAKLELGAVNDPLEQEADRIAEQIMHTAGSDVFPTDGPAQVSRKCANCEDEESEQIQRKPSGTEVGPGPVSDSIRALLSSPGQPLDAATRAFFEPRFRHDFSKVRVHAGNAAQQSAQELNAKAYTAGHDIVFGAGSFAPDTSAGKRLLAHELTHVVQQSRSSAGPVVRRQPKKEQKKEEDKKDASQKQVPQGPVDIAAVLDPSAEFDTLATVVAPGATVVHANSAEDLAKQLKAIKLPIKTLYFVAHMTEDGDVMFTSPGKQDYVPAQILSEKIKGSAQVEKVDFRGCNIAQAPAAMDQIRTTLKATKAVGSTCTLVKQIAGPVKADGVPITRPEQLKDKKTKDAFDRGLKDARQLFVDKKKTCIVNDSLDGYFQTQGKLIAIWANPASMADDAGWDDNKSTCYQKLRTETVDPAKPPKIDADDCKLIEISKKK